MTRVNKTVNNLKRVWKQLDDASGAVYNALENLAQMTDLDQKIKRQVDMIDVTRIDGLKQEIEEMIKEKGGNVND
ncbi:hypothetical protein PQE68_gp029 [Bacillus phage vB_BanS_Sophrita]|uniref:Uncharacterized protein n=1 Tax=Bacillus phage vB_BanS_Sophrita TaxID=2894790 RepID=A0AAE8YUM0_9CAUD|nr:hypothetical protein PQE68_gp029 [Bacillus phage vB_BanS_Sophrita]UGO50620.1 hypothetical protein SOPHRITA_29 [Bacillus phage vB_BanS_Sophrita]